MNSPACLPPDPDASQLQPGVFVVWASATRWRRQILNDLHQRFEVLSVYEIAWSHSLIELNFERFYATRDLRGLDQAHEKGSGPFTVVIVRDPRPRKAPRWVEREEITVNVNFLEARATYRDWTHADNVHCSATPAEGRRDVMMLTGADMNTCQSVARVPRNQPVIRIDRDLAGSHGWESANELISALNECATYALPFERDRPRGQLFDARNQPLEILAGNLPALLRVLNLRPAVQSRTNGGEYYVQVAGSRHALTLHTPGDAKLNASWSHAMLERRVFDHCGYFRLATEDQFEGQPRATMASAGGC